MADLPEVFLVPNGFNKTQFCPEFSIFKGPDGIRYSDKYSDASATWVISASILIFFMKTGFLFVEVAFVSDNHQATRRVVLAKYLDTCASAIGFYLFGYAVSGAAGANKAVLAEENDFIEWFFRFTFASNTATILHGTLVGEKRKLRMLALFLYAFLISAFIHPFIARLLWSPVGAFSPYRFCNGTLNRETGEFDYQQSFPGPNDNIVFFDFAGSGVVHMLGGFGGLVLALLCKLDLHKANKKNAKVERNEHGEYRVSNNFNASGASAVSRSSIKRGSKGSSRTSGGPMEMSTLSANTPSPSADPSLQQTGPSVAYLPADVVVAGGVSINSSVETRHTNADTRIDEEDDFLDWMYPRDSSGEHMEFAALGVLILWMTFFAFNCGTTESVSGKVHHSILGRIALNMVVSGCFGGICGILIALFAQLRSRSRFINTNEIANCILGSLVAITGVCPYIDSPRAIVVGIGATLFYHLGAHAEFRWKINDTARVFPVHGMCGMWGLLCVGILGQANLIRQTYENLCQCLEIRLPDTVDDAWMVFLYQLGAIGVIMAWSVGSCGFVFIVLRAIPMQGFANMVDFLFVDFFDHYILPVLTVIIACKKPGPRRYQRSRNGRNPAKSEDADAEDNGRALSTYEVTARERTAEELFVFEGGMLLTGETEYGTGIEQQA
eukprot:scpid40849/ scgid30611/ Putative ammonium transporter sll0537